MTDSSNRSGLQIRAPRFNSGRGLHKFLRFLWILLFARRARHARCAAGAVANTVAWFRARSSGPFGVLCPTGARALAALITALIVPLLPITTATAAGGTIPLSAWERTQSIDRVAWLRVKWRAVTASGVTTHDKAVLALTWVQTVLVHPMPSVPVPHYTDGKLVTDPIVLFNLKRVYCGQAARFLVDLFHAANFPGRLVQLKAHVAAEVYYGAAWHFLDGDALEPGEYAVNGTGQIASVAEIMADPTLVANLHASNPVFAFFKWPFDVTLTWQQVPYGWLFVRHSYGTGYPQTPYALVKTAAPADLKNSVYGWNRQRVMAPW